MVTFANAEQSTVVKALADGSLFQLYRSSAFATAATTTLGGRDLNTYFEKGQSVSLLMAKDYGEAQDYDPRTNTDATTNDTDYLPVTLTLEKLFTSGFRVYGSDTQVERYVRDYSLSTGGAVRKSFDNYLYNTGFRTWTLAASGDITLGGHPPTTVAFTETSGGVLAEYGDALHRAGGAALNEVDVPESGRYARLSPRAAESLMGAITPVTGSALTEGNIALGQQLLQEPSYMSRDFMMRQFMTRGSNAITGQDAVADLGDGVAFEPISAVAAATGADEFIDGNQSTVTQAGAVRVTVNQTAALAAGVAVGAIGRIGPNGSTAADVNYGVILRVDSANKYVWMIPYNSKGQKVAAVDVNTAYNFSVPAIGAVNVGYHIEHLAFATRLLTEPTPGSGAIVERSTDQDTGLVMQVFKGSYNVHQFKEGIRTACLCGAVPTDFRKGVLLLSA